MRVTNGLLVVSGLGQFGGFEWKAPRMPGPAFRGGSQRGMAPGGARHGLGLRDRGAGGLERALAPTAVFQPVGVISTNLAGDGEKTSEGIVPWDGLLSQHDRWSGRRSRDERPHEIAGALPPAVKDFAARVAHPHWTPETPA